MPNLKQQFVDELTALSEKYGFWLESDETECHSVLAISMNHFSNSPKRYFLDGLYAVEIHFNE